MIYEKLIDHLANWNGSLLVETEISSKYFELISIRDEDKETLGLLDIENLVVVNTKILVTSKIDFKYLEAKLNAINIEIDCRKSFKIA